MTLTSVEADAVALAQIQSYCGWHVAPSEDETRTFDGSGSGVLILPTLCLTDVASVTENGELLDATTAYTWSQSGVLRRTGCRWTGNLRAIEVSYSHGFDEMPTALQSVINELSGMIQRGLGGLLTSKTVGPFSESYGDATTTGLYSVVL